MPCEFYTFKSKYMFSNSVLQFSLIVFTFIILSFQLHAQTGTIRGSVIDDGDGLTIPGVKVEVNGSTIKLSTDLDGQFNIPIAAGVYKLTMSYMSYDTLILENIKVISNEVTLLNETRMKPEGSTQDIGPVTVTATAIRNNENALLTLKRKSPNLIDGISAASFRKIGDGDAASAMKRVPGVSLEGGKYVFIRGIGDRYNKTMLNGMEIPGLDPDRNTLQMDIFPTSIIDNMIVNKTFIADLPADFTGGLIDIELKSFPDKLTRGISISGGFNPNYHLRNDFLTYEGGKTDFLGFDDGTRDIPAINNIPLFSEVIGDTDGPEAQRYKEILRSFNPNLSALRANSFIDYSAGFNYGNQVAREKVTIGYNFLFNYSSTSEYYEDAEYGRYGLSGDSSVTEMDAREFQIGDLGIQNVLISTMGTFAIKTQKAKYRLNILHIQNGESRAAIFDYVNSDQGAEFDGFQHNLEYSERSLTNLLLAGAHSLKANKWKLDWKLGGSRSGMEDPDIRFTRYEVRDNGVLSISTESGFPERIWRDLNESSVSGKLDLERDLKAFKRDASLKFGLSNNFKTRDYVIRNFALNVRNIPLTGDPNELFAEENLWPYNDNPIQGTTYEVPFIPVNPNRYDANALNSGAYASMILNPTKKLKAIVGLRTEYYIQKYTGQDQLGTNVLNNETVLNEIDLFPSLNIVLAMTEKQNFRMSYGKTIARPSLKEMSYAEIFDPITGRTFIGGLFRDANDVLGQVFWDGKLVSTDIHNADLRWEWFQDRGQTISVSAFYKYFIRPIEIVQFATQAGAFQPRNVGNGQVLGGELEIRQNLKFIAAKMEDFSFVANVTVTESRIELSSTEYNSRVDNAREGQNVENYRDMAGQAPFVLNGGIAYNGGEKGFFKALEVGVYYNVQGPTLQYVGMVDRPDVYSVPFHSLNFNLNKKFGDKEQYRAGFGVTNLLDDSRELVFKSFGAQDEYFQRLKIGTQFNAKFSYNF